MTNLRRLREKGRLKICEQVVLPLVLDLLFPEPWLLQVWEDVPLFDLAAIYFTGAPTPRGSSWTRCLSASPYRMASATCTSASSLG